MLVKLGWLAAAAVPGAAGAAALSTVWNRRSNQANFNSQFGHMSGFSAIFRRVTQRFDSCSPELLAVAAASFTCGSITTAIIIIVIIIVIITIIITDHIQLIIIIINF